MQLFITAKSLFFSNSGWDMEEISQNIFLPYFDFLGRDAEHVRIFHKVSQNEKRMQKTACVFLTDIFRLISASSTCRSGL